MHRARQKDYAFRGLSSVESRRTLIYSSNKDEDNFIIYFLVNADQVQQQDAGTYIGKIKYVVETDQGKQEFPIDIQCDIAACVFHEHHATSGRSQFYSCAG